MLNRMVTRIALALLLLMTPPPSPARKPPVSKEREVREALTKFVDAFENLDWEKFRLSFDDNATVFYPRAFPERANGRAEFEKNFKAGFEQIRGQKRTPPYLKIEPRDLKIQIYDDMAIVTFHLDDRPGVLNRRTIALHESSAGWRIVHLHASEVSTTEAGR